MAMLLVLTLVEVTPGTIVTFRIKNKAIIYYSYVSYIPETV